MDRRSTVLGSLAFAVLASFIPLSQVHAQPADLKTQAAVAHGAPKPWKEVRGFGRVLDLSKLPVVIDEPGRYALQRDWNLTGYQMGGEIIRITANDVTLDLHGYEIEIELSMISSTLLAVSGDQVTIRNGTITACCEGAAAFRSTGDSTRLDHLSVGGEEPMELEGTDARISDSFVHARWGTTLNARSIVQRSSISCRTFCLSLEGNDNQVTDNRFSFADADFVVELAGDGNVVERNVIQGDQFQGTTYLVAGDRNVVRNNTIVGGGASVAFAVKGTANTLDGNIVAPPSPDSSPTRTGISFTADGNFYGDNRMSTTVPFELNGTVQTDWGGNVGY